MTQVLREEWGFDGSVVTDYQVGTVGDRNRQPRSHALCRHEHPSRRPRTRNARGSGTWDPELRGGKGGVQVPEGGTDFGDGYTDRMYYYVRTRAMELLYTHVPAPTRTTTAQTSRRTSSAAQ